MSTKVSLRTGVWYGDRQIEIDLPDDWEVDVLRPEFPPPLSDREIDEALNAPVGAPTIQELCRGKSRPLILVDDLIRPTPAALVLPHVMRRIAEAGIPPENVTLLMATGSHGIPHIDALHKKAGPAATRSRLLIHNCFTDAKRAGTTRAGTPVFLNRAVIKADVVLGIGGIYPNHTAGFGGGTKLILGVLGIRSIYALHFSNPSKGWGGEGVDASFRSELDEIARMAGLNFLISPIIDGDRNILKVFCGDARQYFKDAVEYYRGIYETPGVGDADVVIANTYPNDLSLTFARMKGFAPLAAAGPGVSRVAIAALDEGLGLHNIWPFVNKPRNYRWNHTWRVLGVKPGRQILSRVLAKVKRLLFSGGKRAGASPSKNRIWLYRTSGLVDHFLGPIPGIRVTDNWSEIIKGIRQEQSDKEKLKVQVYAFAFLQLIHEKNAETSVESVKVEDVRPEALRQT